MMTMLRRLPPLSSERPSKTMEKTSSGDPPAKWSRRGRLGCLLIGAVLAWGLVLLAIWSIWFLTVPA